LEEVSIPAPADDEVRVQVRGCGICGSDLPYRRREARRGGQGRRGAGIV